MSFEEIEAGIHQQQMELVDQFDDLYNRIGTYAKPLPDGRTEELGKNSTRKAEKIGQLATSFILFESKTSYEYQEIEKADESSGKRLYSPSITAYTGQPGEHFHIKRRELEDLSDVMDAKQLGRLATKLDVIKQLFGEYDKLKRGA